MQGAALTHCEKFQVQCCTQAHANTGTEGAGAQTTNLVIGTQSPFFATEKTAQVYSTLTLIISGNL